MGRKADIKICRFNKCNHLDKKIDISTDDYITEGRKYFHSDCFRKIKEEEKKEKKLKADIQLIKNMWLEHISSTVVLSHLYLEINKLVRERSIDSEYIIFVMQYCIKNNCKLRYPGGLKFYVDKEEIKNAYQKEKISKMVSKADFSIKANETDDTPKFSLNINKKPTGFNSILGGK